MITEEEKPRLAQRALNELTASRLKADGVIGPATCAVIKHYQTTVGLPITGVLDASTFLRLEPLITKRFLLSEDVVAAAKGVGVLPSAVFAISEVEGRGEGFLPDGRPIILFERHKFYQYVTARLGQSVADEWMKKDPNICHPVAERSAYASTGAGEWDRMDRARMLDATCALLSASWGMYQMMGFNYGLAGFDSVQDMVTAYSASEKSHLQGLLGFIKGQPNFLSVFKARNWARVAFYYNGSGYASNHYDTKLATADRKYAKFNDV